MFSADIPSLQAIHWKNLVKNHEMKKGKYYIHDFSVTFQNMTLWQILKQAKTSYF